MQTRIRRAAASAFPPFLVLLAVLGLWYFISLVVMTKDQKFLLPPPHDVVKAGFLTWRSLHEMLLGLWTTTQVALIGLAISIVIGMTIAIGMSRHRWFEKTFFPYAVAIQAVPIIAIVPVIGLWMGFSFRARILVTIIISLFPIITNTLLGLQSVEANYHDLFTLAGADRRTRLWKLQLPSALPAIFTGFRISAGLAVVGAIVGEFFFKQGNARGIGRLLSAYQLRLQTKLLMAAIILASMLGVILFLAVGALGNRLTRAWRTTAVPEV